MPDVASNGKLIPRSAPFSSVTHCKSMVMPSSLAPESFRFAVRSCHSPCDAILSFVLATSRQTPAAADLPVSIPPQQVVAELEKHVLVDALNWSSTWNVVAAPGLWMPPPAAPTSILCVLRLDASRIQPSAL